MSIVEHRSLAMSMHQAQVQKYLSIRQALGGVHTTFWALSQVVAFKRLLARRSLTTLG